MVAKGSTFIKKARIRQCMDGCGTELMVANRSRCDECWKKKTNRQQQARYRSNPEKFADISKRRRAKLRAELITAYGGLCACCGESEHIFLTLEHKNRDGAAHRKSIRVGAGWEHVYKDVKAQGFPTDKYEILCFNCNRASWVLGVCPHRTKTVGL